MCLNSLESSALQISLWAKCEAEFISQIESSAWQIFIIFIGFYFHSCLQTQEEVWRLMASWLMVCSAEGRGRSKEQPNLNTEDCASMWDWCEFHVLLTDILQPKATDEGSERLPFDLFRTQPLFLTLLFLHHHLSQCLPHCVPTLLFMALIRPLYISQNILSSFSLHHLSNATLVTSHLPCSLPPLTTVSVVSRGLPWRAISHTHTPLIWLCSLSYQQPCCKTTEFIYPQSIVSIFITFFTWLYIHKYFNTVWYWKNE